MDINKKQVIQEIVDEHINNFAINFAERYRGELNKPKGVINYKKLNCFISELGGEFVFYSALVRSFDSSFGNILESMGNAIDRWQDDRLFIKDYKKGDCKIVGVKSITGKLKAKLK